MPVRKKAAGKGLTPYPSNRASSTVSVLEGAALEDDVDDDVDELVLEELLELEEEELVTGGADDVDTDEEEETDEEEDVEEVVGVVVDFEVAKTTPAAAMIMTIITITATITLLTADTFGALFFILERNTLNRRCYLLI